MEASVGVGGCVCFGAGTALQRPRCLECCFLRDGESVFMIPRSDGAGGLLGCVAGIGFGRSRCLKHDLCHIR